MTIHVCVVFVVAKLVGGGDGGRDEGGRWVTLEV